MTPEQRKEAHDETHEIIINNEPDYLEVLRIVSHPLWTVKDKAGMLKTRFATTRNYEGKVVGRYANFMQIVRDEMLGLKPMTYDEWRAKYRPYVDRAAVLAKRALAHVERVRRAGWHIYYLEDGQPREYPMVAQTEEQRDRYYNYVTRNMPNVTEVRIVKL